MAHSQSMYKQKEALIWLLDENPPPFRVLFLFHSFEIRAMMTGECKGSGLTWQNSGVSEFERWTVWTLNGKMNEWWFLLGLVITVQLVCLILPPLQCLHAHSMSPRHVFRLPLACHADWVRDSSSYTEMHIVAVGCTQMAGMFSSLSVLGYFIDWTTASRAHRWSVLQGLLPLPVFVFPCCSRSAGIAQ